MIHKIITNPEELTQLKKMEFSRGEDYGITQLLEHFFYRIDNAEPTNDTIRFKDTHNAERYNAIVTKLKK